MAAFSYSYRVPGLIKASAEIAGDICQKLQDSDEGLSPATLLNASRDKNAPLHDEFEWRDDVAAEKFRLEQAQRIIRNIVIIPATTEETEPEPTRAFVCTPGGKSAYVSIHKAMSNDEWREHLLIEARRDMGFFAQKYRRLKELSGVISEIDKVLEGQAM